jgi:single-stranded DNA-binding protein
LIRPSLQGDEVKTNQLNSIIIEGAVTCKKAREVTHHGRPVQAFHLESKRFTKLSVDQNGTEIYRTDTIGIMVIAEGKLGENVARMMSRGKQIRVVGRLETIRVEIANDEIVQQPAIYAEHIEYKSMDITKAEHEMELA